MNGAQDTSYPGPMPISSPINNYWQSEFHALQYQIEAQPILEDIEHSLKCEILTFNQVTGQFCWATPEGVKPMMNQAGVNSVLTIMRPALSKVFLLSDFEEDQIRKITISTGQNVVDDLNLNWELYEIKDFAAASKIRQIVTNTAFATLRKANKGTYLKFLRTTSSIQEVQHHSTAERPAQDNISSGGILARLFGKRR